jgi:GTPase SAR1 family protein
MQARDTLERFGQPEDVDLLSRALRRTVGPPTVVVVGEVKRGKSTLVNALTGARVSPTSAEVITLGIVAVVPPTVALPVGAARLLYPQQQRVVPTELAVRALSGTQDDPTADRPIGAEIALESRWLPGVAVLDTPGVGGLASAHGRRAREAAAKASALLFVTDGAQPLTAPELDFLRELSEGVEHVVFVLTKTDRNPGGWQEILQENRDLLRRHAPRFAHYPIHPVAASYAVHAIDQPAESVDLLEQASGVPALAATVNQVLSDARRAAVVNALRAGHTGLERVAARVDLELAAVDDEEIRADLRAEETRLAGLQLQQRRGRMDLERDLGRVREAALTLVNDRCEQIVGRLSAKIQGEWRGMRASAKAQFHSELESELSALEAEFRALVRARLEELVERAFGSLAAVPPSAGDVTAELPSVAATVRSRPAHLLNPLVDPSLAGTTFMGSHLLSLAGIGGPLGLLVGGGAMLAINLAFRGVRQGQQELAGTMNESVAGLKRELTAAVDSWVRELRPELAIALEDHLKTSIEEVRAVMVEANRAARGQAEARATTVARLERRAEAVRSRLAVVDARLRTLTRSGTSSASQASN